MHTSVTQCTRVHTSVKQRTGVHASVCTRVHAWAQVCTGGHMHVCTPASYAYKQPCTPAHTPVNTRARLFSGVHACAGRARLCECGVHACATSATPVHACFRGVHACPDTFSHVCTPMLRFHCKCARVPVHGGVHGGSGSIPRPLCSSVRTFQNNIYSLFSL